MMAYVIKKDGYSAKLDEFEERMLLERYADFKKWHDVYKKYENDEISGDLYSKANSKLKGFVVALNCLGIEIVEE